MPKESSFGLSGKHLVHSSELTHKHCRDMEEWWNVDHVPFRCQTSHCNGTKSRYILCKWSHNIFITVNWWRLFHQKIPVRAKVSYSFKYFDISAQANTLLFRLFHGKWRKPMTHSRKAIKKLDNMSQAQFITLPGKANWQDSMSMATSNSNTIYSLGFWVHFPDTNCIILENVNV